MSLENLKKNITNLQNSLGNIKKENLSLRPMQVQNISDFRETRNIQIQKSVNTFLNLIKQDSETLSNEIEPESLVNIRQLINKIDIAYINDDIDDIKDNIGKLAEALIFTDDLIKTRMITKPQNISEEIKEDVYADIEELEKSFESCCYRSCVILCGRILEVALHRKVFEVTGQDFLEKAPGMGLGKIIAKLKENDVPIDPGLTQQIHLINQIRVFSVHKKESTFYPSKNQAQAIILYTMDVVEKLFK
ncbi:MAG: hypothetical protein ABII01_04795 [Candidatus Woesearchaeota archaeon]